MGIFDKILGKKGPEQEIRTYQDFWNWFQTKEKDFYEIVKNRESERIEKDFFDVISPKLRQLNDHFYFLTGMYDDATAELIITVDGDVRNIVFAEELIKEAPQLEHWLFTALKPAKSIENAAIQMNGYEFTKDNIFFYSNESEEYPDEIDLTFVYEGLNEENKGQITSGICVFLDHFLGELHFTVQIDTFNIIGKEQAEKELVPIGKLNDFLQWREREFTEKYKNVRDAEEEGQFSVLRAELNNGRPLIACIDLALMKYNAKASYPWISELKVHYNGDNNDGLPEQDDFEKLNQIEDLAIEALKREDGHLYIGRETADNLKESYFASKDFRQPSKVLKKIIKDHPDYKIELKIYKDKYWQRFRYYNNVN
ncbi:MAG: DUF695 domain-containing protein [Chryseobacterium sp.]|jgi:hypothetical protein|uniref:DUF695 domain-containing protein n=1 Tax=Chryseobacterium sp. TaxID=1871047 RepID=UPI002838FFA2|nr:DUF695 domain-containing protein [Chryseobacterium sp.]MDR2236723.1 DUF695 domain-containing protein [Chryseobacterium sp.]